MLGNFTVGVDGTQHFVQWQLPTLLSAGADRRVAPRGSAALAAAAPPAGVTAQAYPELFHEIFNEPDRAQVLARLKKWLNLLPPTNPVRSLS